MREIESAAIVSRVARFFEALIEASNESAILRNDIYDQGTPPPLE